MVKYPAEDGAQVLMNACTGVMLCLAASAKMPYEDLKGMVMSLIPFVDETQGVREYYSNMMDFACYEDYMRMVGRKSS